MGPHKKYVPPRPLSQLSSRDAVEDTAISGRAGPGVGSATATFGTCRYPPGGGWASWRHARMSERKLKVIEDGHTHQSHTSPGYNRTEVHHVEEAE